MAGLREDGRQGLYLTENYSILTFSNNQNTYFCDLLKSYKILIMLTRHPISAKAICWSLFVFLLSCKDQTIPTIQIPIKDPTPPSVRWYVTDENGTTELTAVENKVKAKRGLHYGISLFCKDEDGGVKIISIDREVRSYCECPDGTTFSTNDVQKKIALVDFSSLEKTKAAGLKEWMATTGYDTPTGGCPNNCGGESSIYKGGSVTFFGTGENFRGGSANSNLTLYWD